MKKKGTVQKSIVSALESDNQEWKTRVIAGVAIAVCSAILLMETQGALNSANPKTGSDFIFLALLIIQFIFPVNRILLALVTISAGLINVYYNGHVLGLLFYAFGLSLLLKEGFFRTDKKLKIPLLFGVFFIVLALQYRIGLNKVIISLVNIVMATALIWGFIFIFHDNLKEFYSAKAPLDLRPYRLSPRQIACVRACHDRKPIREIAESLNVPDAEIKEQFLAIYGILDVFDRHELFELIEGRELIF